MFAVPDPLVNATFDAPRGWRSAHMQTLRSRLRPAPAPTHAMASTRVLSVPMDDGTGDALRVAVHTPRPSPAHEPAPQLVLLVHGLGGSAESPYVLATAAALLGAGIAAARLDLRGAGRTNGATQQMYHAGRTADVRTVLRALADTPEASRRSSPPTLGIVGFSLGGNVTLKLLGEPLEDLPVRAGVAVSTPLDLATGTEHLSHRMHGLYQRFLVSKLRSDTAHSGLALTPQERAAISRMRTITEFDDLITAKHNGWRDAAEYYAVNSSAQFLPQITVPTLVIHAMDDPMVPASSYRAIDWTALEASTPVRRLITAHGGHVGFHEDGGRDLPWYVGRAVEHFDAV